MTDKRTEVLGTVVAVILVGGAGLTVLTGFGIAVAGLIRWSISVYASNPLALLWVGGAVCAAGVAAIGGLLRVARWAASRKDG